MEHSLNESRLSVDIILTWRNGQVLASLGKFTMELSPDFLEILKHGSPTSATLNVFVSVEDGQLKERSQSMPPHMPNPMSLLPTEWQKTSSSGTLMTRSQVIPTSPPGDPQ